VRKSLFALLMLTASAVSAQDYFQPAGYPTPGYPTYDYWGRPLYPRPHYNCFKVIIPSGYDYYGRPMLGPGTVIWNICLPQHVRPVRYDYNFVQ
jgi:hypothetical protein